jgi:hypothetical protein
MPLVHERQWLTPAISATQKAERRIMVQSQPKKIV